MPDLLINKSIAGQQQEQGYQNIPANSVLDRIQNSDINRNLYSSFISRKTIQKRYSLDTYKKNLKDKKKKEMIFTIAGGVTLLLGGLSVILGRKNLINIREKLNQSVEFMQSLKDSEHLKGLGRAKLAVTKFLNNALGYMFTFDKVKDFSLLKGFESSGKLGKTIINASKGSLWITEKTTLIGLYKAFSMSVNSAGKSVEKALKMPKNFSNEQEKQLAERLNVLLNGNKENKGLTKFADNLIIGAKQRTGKLKNIILSENIGKYREKYYPTSFKWSEFKRTASNWKESLLSATGNKDVLRENWSKTEEILVANINATGANNGKIKNLGQARQYIEDIAKEMEELSKKSGCSDEFKNLTEQVQNLNNRINRPLSVKNPNPIIFETSGEKYAGRVLDLSAGGGMSEILIPPVAGGLIAYHTLKDSKSGERKEKFIRSGGPELIGALAGWMITSNLLAISGAAGMLAGLATAGIINVLSKSYLRHIEKTQKLANGQK